MLLKVCTTCGIEKLVDLAHFYHHPSCAGGFDSACRLCRNIQRNEWRKKHRDRLAERRRKLYAEHYGNKCEVCGWAEARCDVHHRKLKSRGGLHTIENAIVLCPNHHRVEHDRKR